MTALWIITALFLGVIGWMIYAHFNKQKKINEYLENADPILFQKMGSNIEVAFQAPPGSVIQPYTLMMVEQPQNVIVEENISEKIN